MVKLRTLAIFLAAAAGCAPAESITFSPLIEAPEDDDADPYAMIDEVVLSVASPGDAYDIMAQRFLRGQPLELTGVPIGEDLVLHMVGRSSGTTVAYGRTCTFSLSTDGGGGGMSPRLFFSRSKAWGDGPAMIAPDRINGFAVSDDAGGAVFAGGEGADGAPLTSLERFSGYSGALAPIDGLLPRRNAATAMLSDGRIVIAGGEDTVTGEPIAVLEVITLTSGSAQIERVNSSDLEVSDLALVSIGGGALVAFGGDKKTQGGGGDANGHAPSDEVVEVRAADGTVTVRKLNGRLAQARWGHSATAIAAELGGGVLIAGGLRANGNPVQNAELFKPQLGDFSRDFVGQMEIPRSGHQAVALGDGSIVFLGGIDREELPVATIELFSFDRGFVAIGELPADGPVANFSATRIAADRVLIAGGTSSAGVVLDRTYLLHIGADGTVTSSPAGRLSQPRANHQAAALCDGTVLLTGGAASGEVAERFNPAVDSRL
jgi:hypothetical protein